MDSFNDALIRQPTSISSDVKNALIITSNYNLLDNDNISVSWADNTVSVKRPSGLSNLSKIRYRNFKGSMLPFTAIDLPKFRVEVVLTGENVGAAYITGIDGIYGERKDYNLFDRDGNTLLTFDKAWTYDSNASDQLQYNIEEAVREVNRRLKVMYPFKSFYNEFDLSETYDNDYINKVYFDTDLIPINNNPGSSVLGYSKSKNKFVMVHINNSGEYEQVDMQFNLGGRSPVYAAMSYDRNICLYMNEHNHDPSAGGTNHIRCNTSAEDNVFNYSWNLNSNRWEYWTTLNNYFNFYTKSPSCCMSTVNNNNSVCLGPMTSINADRPLSVIIDIVDRTNRTVSNWYLDFRQRAKNNIVNIIGYGDVVDKDGNSIDNLLSILAIYVDINATSNDVYTIGYFELTKTEISSNVSEPTVIINPVATKTIQSSEWSDRCKLMTCGKECYGVVKAVDASKTYIWFCGCWVLSYVNYDIDAFYLAEGYKYDNDNLFMFDDYHNEWALTAFLPSTTNLTSWIKDIIYEEGGAPFSVGGNPVLRSVNPPLFIRGSQNSIKGIVSNPTTYNTEFPDYSVNNPNYFNIQHTNNALKCETESMLNMNVTGKDMAGGKIETLINKDFVITNSHNFFEFNDDGNIKTSQICLTSNSAINMALRIYTDPYYFEFTTPIGYYTSDIFSLIHPIVEPVFNTINEHVLTTIETLILTQYEYNGLYLVCGQFPNSDGVIFYINEDAHIEFKTMGITNIVNGLTLQIHSNGEPIRKELLEKLYGKLSISVDWEQ